MVYQLIEKTSQVIFGMVGMIMKLALILGIDRFMSEARALTNIIGNGVATVVVAKWTGDLDQGRMERVLDGGTPDRAGDLDAEPS